MMVVTTTEDEEAGVRTRVYSLKVESATVQRTSSTLARRGNNAMIGREETSKMREQMERVNQREL